MISVPSRTLINSNFIVLNSSSLCLQLILLNGRRGIKQEYGVREGDRDESEIWGGEK